MTLEPTKNLCSRQNKTDIAKTIDRLQNEGQHSHNKIISCLFSGDQNFSKNFPPHAKVTLVKHIESNMLKENDATRLNLETDIEHVKTLLKGKRSDGFDDDIVAYLCRKYLKEANSDYQDKKYEDALNKYKLVLECLSKMKKDEKLLEDTQNVIASCYCGLGIQKKTWEEKIKNYDYGLKYASNKFLQNILTENKTIVVNNALKEAKNLIDRLNYNGALDICKKILVMPPISELTDDTVKIETKKLLFIAFTGEGKKALQQANRAPKIDKYNEVINLFKEALSFTNEDYKVCKVNEDIALALTGILRTQFNKQEYYEAIETCKEGLKYTKNSEMIKKFKTQCIKIFKKIIEHQHKEEVYSKAIKICEESLKYTEHPEIIDTFKMGCILIFQKWKEYVNKIGSLEQYLKYEQNLEKAKDLPNLLSDKLEIYDKIYEHLLEEGKQKEAMEYISKIINFLRI